MNKLLLIIPFLFLSCKQISEKKVSNNVTLSDTFPTIEKPKTKVEKQIISTEVELEQIKFNLTVEENENLKKIHFSGINSDINIYAFNEGYSFLNYLKTFYPLEFNYTYDSDFEYAISKVHFFKSKKNELFLILPSYTEEFLTFQIINIDNEIIKDLGLYTLSTEEFQKLKNLSEIEKFAMYEDKGNISLSCFRKGIRINFDTLIENTKANSKPLDESDKKSISKF